MERARTLLKSQNKLLANLEQACLTLGLISPDCFYSTHLFCCAYPTLCVLSVARRITTHHLDEIVKREGFEGFTT